MRRPHSAVHRADRRVLALLRGCGADPYVGGAAKAFSGAGEHAAVWLAAGLAGACTEPHRRAAWLRATAVVAGSHLASMALKRLVRRPRPHLPSAAPLVRTAGHHSFPSSHATSSTAAALLFAPLTPTAPLRPLATAICLSRLVTGVHYPSDILCGIFLGAGAALAGRRWAVRPGSAPTARRAAATGPVAWPVAKTAPVEAGDGTASPAGVASLLRVGAAPALRAVGCAAWAGAARRAVARITPVEAVPPVRAGAGIASVLRAGAVPVLRAVGRAAWAGPARRAVARTAPPAAARWSLPARDAFRG